MEMELSNDEIIQLIQQGRTCRKINDAISQENRISFHGKIENIPVDYNATGTISLCDNPYYKQYLTWVQAVIGHEDKFKQFTQILTFPLSTNTLCESITDEYNKVFTAEDSVLDIKFNTDSNKERFTQLLEKIKDSSFWETKVIPTLISKVNSLIVIDADDEEGLYYYLLDIENVVNIKEEDGEVKHILFKEGDNEYIFIDQTYYRKYEKQGETLILVLEILHNIGYCPVRFLWSDIISGITRYSPLSSELSNLDWYLFVENCQKVLTLTNNYPIYWSYESKCDFELPTGEQCNNGVIAIVDNSSESGYVYTPCPACKEKKLVSAGSYVTKPLPKFDEDGRQLSIPDDPMGIINIDKSALDANIEAVDRLYDKIFFNATGKSSKTTVSAINEKQVQSQYESQTNIINWLARQIESAKKWTYETLAIALTNEKPTISVSLGTRFYLQTNTEAIDSYKAAKDSGVPEYILLDKIKAIANSTDKNDPSLKQRNYILNNLLPYQNYTAKELKDIGIDVKDSLGFLIKVNFTSLINRFEREFGNIEYYGSNLDINTRINKINEKLKAYGEETNGKPSL